MGTRSRPRPAGKRAIPPFLEVRGLTTRPGAAEPSGMEPHTPGPTGPGAGRLHGAGARSAGAGARTGGAGARTGGGGLRGVGFGVAAGAAVALFGPGARTVVAVLAGRVPAAGGAILLQGAEQPRGIGVGHLIGPVLDSGASRTVADHLDGCARTRGDDGGASAVLDVFPRLRARAGAPLGALTDGEHRLLGLAEALLIRPRLLLVDGLTPGLAGDALPAVVRRLLDAGAAAVLAEPVIPVALAVASRACVLADGRIAADLPAPRPERVAELLRSVRPPQSEAGA